MAIFKPSALIGAISGSIGSVTFVNARGASVVRPRPAKVKRDTQTQIEQQALTHFVSNAWADLAQGFKNQWVAQAAITGKINRLGVRRPTSGYALFVEQNLQQNQFGDPSIVQSPQLINTKVLSAVTLLFEVGGPYNVTMVGSPAPAGSNYLIYAARSFRDQQPSKYVHRKKLIGGLTFVNPIDVFLRFRDLLGEMVLGEAFQIQARLGTSTSLYSKLITAQSTVKP